MIPPITRWAFKWQLYSRKRARSSAIWTVTIRTSSAISHPRKTGLRSSCKISVSVYPFLFLAFWHFGQEHHPAPNWAWADKLGSLYSCLKTKTRNRIDKILMFATLPMRRATYIVSLILNIIWFQSTLPMRGATAKITYLLTNME